MDYHHDIEGNKWIQCDGSGGSSFLHYICCWPYHCLRNCYWRNVFITQRMFWPVSECVDVHLDLSCTYPKNRRCISLRYSHENITFTKTLWQILLELRTYRDSGRMWSSNFNTETLHIIYIKRELNFLGATFSKNRESCFLCSLWIGHYIGHTVYCWSMCKLNLVV